MEKLAKIQKELRAPKNQYNSFGKYNYRSCEDILEAVKPLLDGAILTLSDEIIEVGGRVYVKATATFRDGDYEKSVTASAREPAERKGMDASQITGTASSYARKYAANGLFLIDDTKDADTMDNTKQQTTQAKQLSAKAKPQTPPAPKQAEPQKEHWCKEHDTKFFKKGRMKAYAHPLGDTGEWCHEHIVVEVKPADVNTPPANGKVEEVLQYVADQMKFANTGTAKLWLVNSMNIEKERINSDPEGVLKEVADLQGWNL